MTFFLAGDRWTCPRCRRTVTATHVPPPYRRDYLAQARDGHPRRCRTVARKPEAVPA